MSLQKEQQDIAEKIIQKTNVVVNENRILKRKLQEASENMENLEYKYQILEEVFCEVVQKSTEMLMKKKEGINKKKCQYSRNEGEI